MRKQGDTYLLDDGPVYLLSHGCCVGRKEREGPLAGRFDQAGQDNWFGETTWEKSECRMVQLACRTAIKKAGLHPHQIGCALGGDLLNQCVSTSFAMRTLGTPFLGLYGACSTMAESMLLGAVLVGAGLERTVLCSASSHFCSAERQYRYPLEYGGQRTPTAQWTATAAGAVILTDAPTKVAVTALQPGRIFDPGVKDAANMGAAMAQSAFETIHRFLRDTGTGPEDYDLIVTGDLSAVGKGIVLELLRDEGIELRSVYDDCGMMLYDGTQDVHAGGSGCGCSAAVLCAYLLPALEQGLLKKVLFCGTGALLSPLTTNQGETIPGICHAVLLEAVP